MTSLIKIRKKRMLAELANTQSAALDRGVALIIKYLEKRIGKLYQMPGVETFTNSRLSGQGLRYFTEDGRSFRLNWKGAPSTASSIVSVDVWNGTTRDPNISISADGVSLVQVLPSLADLIQRPVTGEFQVVAEGAVHRGSMLLEARAGAGAAEVYDELIDMFLSGTTFSENKINQIGRTTGLSLWRKIIKTHPDFFTVERKGSKSFIQLADGIEADDFDRDAILGSTVSLISELGGRGEAYSADGSEAYQAQARKENAIPYEEQLDDLRKLIRATVNGASNSLWICGAGGVGKTHIAEQELNAMGMTDGDGYYKNTTSASAAGMYRVLYDHRDSIVLFDDCDNVFKDQESRNLLKAATDTKENRKVSWGKKSFWIYQGNPADLEDRDNDDGGGIFDGGSEDFDDEDKKYPKYFDFKGRIIFISNLSLDKLDPDGALRTRGFIISINPTNDELVTFMGKILDKIEVKGPVQLTHSTRLKVLELVKNAQNGESLNIRKLVRGLNMAATGTPGWEKLVERYA
jgi:hypothetical protein